MTKPKFHDRGREDELRALLKERVLVLDGAMGTAIQARDLKAADFGGPEYEGCNEHLVLTRPDVVRDVHESYLAAGADIVEANAFGSLKHVLAEYDLQEKVLELNRAAAKLAKEACAKYSTVKKPRFVAGALGPGTKTISVTGGIGFDEVAAAYADAAQGLLEGGADFLLLETQQDTLNVKASLNGFAEAFERLGRRVPVMLSASIETMGTMLGGQTAEALADSMGHAELLALGLNCATGPDFMTDHLRTISELAHSFTICYPNAGLPDENGHYNETPEMISRKLERFVGEGWVNIVGGCCGTTAAHIKLIAQMADQKPPRRAVKRRRCAVSGLESYVIEEDRRPSLVGERTNVIGSRLFKEMIVAGKVEEAAEVGRRQTRAGAHIVDVCLANPDRDEKTDMIQLLELLTKKIKAPVMIDSTDPVVIEEALKRTPGKSIVNSINLEDGEERFEKIVPLLKKYGAAVVVGTIDEDGAQGMAVTRERKLAVAVREHQLLVEKYGLRSEDLIFDPLVFPAGTGDKNYWGSAVETIEGIRLIKHALPHCKTILGISNVSFGLPPAGREILNSVFLHLCVEAGLDLAIVNAEKLARYAQIPEEEKKLCVDVLHAKDDGPVAAFTAHFREKKVAAAGPSERSKLPIDERLARNVIEGSKEGLIDDLEILLKERDPLQIINGPLMKGMDEVGRLFGLNEMIVAEVLQSAEVMKAAVAHLEPKMDKSKAVTRGKVLLATVKGDVHDIGKNLVHIILKNNGYDVTDLGIKVAPEALIEAVKKISPHIIGLSGLLVKSAQQMTVTADDLTNAGITIPVLVGGAALSAKFTATKIAPRYDGPVFYAKDAMTGLDLSNQLRDGKAREKLLEKNKEIQEHLATPVPNVSPDEHRGGPLPRPASIRKDHDIPTPPDLKLHVLEDFSVEDIFRYVNPVMLFGKHLGLKGNLERLLKEDNPKAVELARQIKELQNEVLAQGLIKAKAVYKFFAAKSDGDAVELFDSPSSKSPTARFEFPRQPAGERLGLADFVLPKALGKPDYLALFVVTCGAGVRELSDRYRDAGEYFKSHALQSLAIESAEGFAELLHERVRAMWGIKDDPALTIKDKFQAKYRGLRVSFGYPACPNLEDQTKLFMLLSPEKIGVNLTEGFMMEPEASVSALVFHHPEARYFSVGQAAVVEP